MDIGDSASLQLVGMFCYLGDMLSVDGYAVEARVCTEWNKFRQLVPLITNKNVSLLMKENYTEVLCLVVCYMAVKHGQ